MDVFRRSQHAAANLNGGQVIGLTQAAGRDRDLLPAPMRAAITQQEAQGYALDGDENLSQRKLDEAHEWAAKDLDGDARDGHGSFCTESYIELQRAGCWLVLDQPKRAIRLYEAIIPLLPKVYRRDRGMALSRLAAAYTAAGEHEHAARVAVDALSIAESTGSVRTLNEVSAVGQRLLPHRRQAPVAQLLDKLQATNG